MEVNQNDETNVVKEEKLEEIWSDLNAHLQQGIGDVQALQKAYNLLTKFMSLCMVALSSIQEELDDLFEEPDTYLKETRELIIKNLHYNERRMLRHLKLPKEKKALAMYRDGLVQRFEQCKDVQRILYNRLETFKLDYQLSGGSYEI